MKYNTGIAILKFVAAICVVFHYGPALGVGGSLLSWATPAFMFISFYLLSDKIETIQLHKRFRRIYIPFWFWGILCWSVFGVSGGWSVSDLFLQLVLGVPVCKPLYFMADLAGLTVIVYLICRCQKTCYKFAMLACLLAVAFLLEYSGMNYNICSILDSRIAPVFGRIIEFVPYAVAAIVLRRTIKYLVSVRCALGVALIFVGIICLGIPCLRRCLGFGYQGLGLFFATIGVCFISICTRMDRICSERHARQLGFLATGIYMSHIFVGWVIRNCFGLETGILLVACVCVGSISISLILKNTRFVAEIAF